MRIGYCQVNTARETPEDRLCKYCDNRLEKGELVFYSVNGRKRDDGSLIRFTERLHLACVYGYYEELLAKKYAKQAERFASGESRRGPKPHDWTEEQKKARGQATRYIYRDREQLRAAYWKNTIESVHNSWKRIIRRLGEMSPEIHGEPVPTLYLDEDMSQVLFERDPILYEEALKSDGTPESWIEILMDYYKFDTLEPYQGKARTPYNPPKLPDVDRADVEGTDEFYIKWYGGVRPDGSVVETPGLYVTDGDGTARTEGRTEDENEEDSDEEA